MKAHALHFKHALFTFIALYTLPSAPTTTASQASFYVSKIEHHSYIPMSQRHTDQYNVIMSKNGKAQFLIKSYKIDTANSDTYDYHFWVVPMDDDFHIGQLDSATYITASPKDLHNLLAQRWKQSQEEENNKKLFNQNLHTLGFKCKLQPRKGLRARLKVVVTNLI